MRAEEGDESIEELAAEAKQSQKRIDDAIDNPQKAAEPDNESDRAKNRTDR